MKGEGFRKALFFLFFFLVKENMSSALESCATYIFCAEKPALLNIISTCGSNARVRTHERHMKARLSGHTNSTQQSTISESDRTPGC